MRLSVAVSVITLSLATASLADSAQAAMRAHTEIPPGNLALALKSLADQRGFQIVFATKDVASIQTEGAVGDLTSNEALKRLLVNTGLAYQYLDDKTVTISREAGAGRETPAIKTVETPQEDKKEGGKSSSQGFRVAQVDQGLVQNGSSIAEAHRNSVNGESGAPALTEIIVTAQKRNERLQDVPVPVSALSADRLAESNQLRLQDYFGSVPGLTVAPGVSSNQVLAIRGVATGLFTNPTVGIEVDDVPYGASTYLGGGQVVPDIDPGDLARIEVLRGPQGTLYGASSMGGLIKYVTVDPSTERLTGRIEAGTSHVYNGAEPGYNVRGSVNIPLGDTIAIRASAFTRQDPGYIDNPVLGIDGINKAHASGGRLAGLWQPSEDFSLKLSALMQDYRGNGSNDVDVPTAPYVLPPLSGLQQSYLPGMGAYDRRVQAYSATIKLKLGSVDLISVSGYNVNSFKETFDYTYGLSYYTEQLFQVDGTPEYNDNSTRKFTQELRLSGHAGPMIDWLVGGFFTHENSSYSQTLYAENTSTYAIVGGPDVLSFPTTYQEYAGFADLTFHITDRFDVQLGARESEIKQTVNESEVGPYVPSFWLVPSPFIAPEQESKTSAFTYLVTPRFKITPDLMVYARLASGYRAGGPNAAPGAPLSYSPDKTQNYELGFKGDFLDHSLSLDTSLYYINWKDIQLSLLTPNFFGYNGNGSRAKSQGIEVSAEARPFAGTSIAAWIAFSDAELTEALPTNNAVGVPGDRLPYSSRFSGNLSAQQDFPIWNNVKGYVGAALSYVGSREGEFASLFSLTPQRQVYPAYARTDLRAGVKYESWSTNLYVNNVTDRRGILSGGLNAYPPYAFTYIQPRTLGVSFEKTF